MCRKFLKTKKIPKFDMVKIQNMLLMNEHLSVSLQQCLFLQLGEAQQNSQMKMMFSSLGDQVVDNAINESKNSILNCYNYILHTLLTSRPKSDMKQSSFYNNLNHFLPTNIICLIKYVSDPSFDLHQALKYLIDYSFIPVRNTHVSNIINNLMKIITYCGAQTEFY